MEFVCVNCATRKIIDFILEAEYDTLPEAVVLETKRLLLDSVGCALPAVSSEKGRLSIKVAVEQAARPESSILGTKHKTSAANAAFANGELINALDYDNILVSHVSPYVIPATLAFAESHRVSGRRLILATALAHEVSTRVLLSLTTSLRSLEGEQPNVKADFNYNTSYSPNVFGGVAGAGKILGLDREKMQHAFGLAGHFSPLGCSQKWFQTAPASMAKYLSGGWISQAEVFAVLLAESGYTAVPDILDGELGYWRTLGSEKCKWEKMLAGLGSEWYFPSRICYKPYPCCAYFAPPLDLFTKIIKENALTPEDINEVRIQSDPIVSGGVWFSEEVRNAVDTQFVTAYPFAAAAFRADLLDWQDAKVYEDPAIVKFMKKVKWETHPEFVYESYRKFGDIRWKTRVEVIAKNRVFVLDTVYAKGEQFIPGTRMTDEELASKFRHNASRVLTRQQIDEAIHKILHLEDVQDVSEICRVLGPR